MKSRLMSGVLIVLVLLAMQFQIFHNFDNTIYDNYLEGQEGVNKDIVIVAIDDTSIDTLGQWPFDRDLHAKLIDTISSGNPKVIGVDLLFDSGKEDSTDDALGKAIAQAGNVIMAEQIVYTPLVDGYKQGSDKLIDQIDAIGYGAKNGHINTYPDKDRVVRKTQLFANRFNIKTESNELIPSFSYQIVETYLGSDNQQLKKFFNKNESYYIDYKGIPKQFDNIPYYMVLEGDIPPSYFEDKIVIIGPYANGLQDEYITPIMPEQPMFGVEIHANIIQDLLEDSLKHETPTWLNMVIVILLGVLSYVASRKLKPLGGFFANVVLLVAFLVITKLVYQMGFVLHIFYGVIGVLMIYMASLAYHYIEQLLEKHKIKTIFGKYVAPQVVDQILARPEIELGGERRMITTLFVDIRGFTPLSESCEPEEIVGILNQYLDLCENAIFEYKGTLDKFIGDATMAIYNAPLPLEDHALQAVKTAWAMKKGAQALKQNLLEKYGKVVDFGIGVNTGYAVVGNIGSKRRMDYTAIGDTVNTAARLESNAQAGQILISEATYQVVKDKIKARPLGELKVKGKEILIPIYEVEGVIDEDI